MVKFVLTPKEQGKTAWIFSIQMENIVQFRILQIFFIAF